MKRLWKADIIYTVKYHTRFWFLKKEHITNKKDELAQIFYEGDLNVLEKRIKQNRVWIEGYEDGIISGYDKNNNDKFYIGNIISKEVAIRYCGYVSFDDLKKYMLASEFAEWVKDNFLSVFYEEQK
jgi:hypothetical protein